MSRIINPNQPEPSAIEKVVTMLAQQQREVIAAILVLQRDVEDLKRAAGVEPTEQSEAPEDSNG